MTGTQKVKLARKYKKDIAKLNREIDKLYAKAVKELGCFDKPVSAYEYFMYDQVGYSTFEENLRANS